MDIESVQYFGFFRDLIFRVSGNFEGMFFFQGHEKNGLYAGTCNSQNGHHIMYV